MSPDFDLDSVNRQTKFFADYLPQQGVSAGAGLEYSGMHHYRAVGIQRYRRMRLAACRRTVGHRDAAADVGAFVRPVARGGYRGFQRFLGTNVLEYVPQWVLVALLKHVLHAEDQRVHAQLPGNLVHVGLGGEDRLRLAGGAHESSGHRVGVDLYSFQ